MKAKISNIAVYLNNNIFQRKNLKFTEDVEDKDDLYQSKPFLEEYSFTLEREGLILDNLSH
jgi:hypothetical protein